MSAEASTIDEEWRTFLRERCRDDVKGLIEAYPDRRSLYVDLLELHEFDAEFAANLFAEPERYLSRGESVLGDLHEGFDRVNVRVENNPGLLPLQDLRTRHAAELVTVEGRVTETGPVHARVAAAVYRCPDCGHAVRARPSGPRLSPPAQCEECGAAAALELVRSRSTLVDAQRLRLEDSPGDGDGTGDGGADAADGSSGRPVDVYLEDDLVHAVSAGDHLLVTGVVGLERRDGANRFDFYLDAVAVDDDPSAARPDETEDVTELLGETIESRWRYLIDQ